MKRRSREAVMVVMAVFALIRPALAQQVMISGSVTTTTGVPLAGVKMSGLPGEPGTDSNGRYAAKVSRGWSGTVMPVHPCYSFSPPSTGYVELVASQSASYAATVRQAAISGHVKTFGGAAIPAVVLEGLPGSPATDTFGFYGVTVPCGWSGTVTPGHAGLTFSPGFQSYSSVSASQTNQDYVGAGPGPVTISGYVRTREGKPIPGATVSGLPGPPITDASGFYSVKVSNDWSGTATPSLAGYTFDPPSIFYMHVSMDASNQSYVGSGPAVEPHSGGSASRRPD